MLKLLSITLLVAAVNCAPQGIATSSNSNPPNVHHSNQASQRLPQSQSQSPQPSVSANPQSGQQFTRNGQPIQFQHQPHPQQFAPQQQPPQPQHFHPQQQPGPQQHQGPHPGAQQFPPQNQGHLRPPQQPQEDRQPQQPGQPQYPGSPQIYWGRCPQLEPTMEEKVKKASVITKCLEVTPVPQNITQESVEVHREQVAACALQMEGWFNEKGLYKYDKAESEIKAKRLSKEIEERILSYHKQCKEEAEEKFPVSNKNLISQIQLYQACMDYFISDVCGIDVLRR